MPALSKVNPNRILLSLGGSLVVPDGGIDTAFLSELNLLIRKWVELGYGFIIVVGGGKLARNYRDAGKDVVGQELTIDDLDWLGIHATRLNAHLIRTIFRDIAHPVIVDDYTIIFKPEEPVLVGAGWKPGFSTDYDAVILAEDHQIKRLINMSNIDYVYTADPKKDPKATPIERISWRNYRKMIGSEWMPGMNAPFDPVASRKAQGLRLKAQILNGRNLANLEKCFSGEEFVGTTIS